MVLMKKCCFMSIRSGSYVSSLFTLVVYTVIFMVSTVNFHELPSERPVFSVIVSCLIFLSVLVIIASIILLLGITGDNDSLLLPWIFSVSFVTLLEMTIIVYIMVDGPVDPFKVIMIIFDGLICLANVFGMMCVISLYFDLRQEKSVEPEEHRTIGKRPNKMAVACSKDMEEVSKEYLLSASPQRLTITSQTEDDNKSSSSYLSVK